MLAWRCGHGCLSDFLWVKDTVLDFHQLGTGSSNVEARRNCFLAIPELLCTLRLRVTHGQHDSYSLPFFP